MIYMLVGVDRRRSRRFAVVTNNKLSNNAHSIRQELLVIINRDGRTSSMCIHQLNTFYPVKTRMQKVNFGEVFTQKGDIFF